MTTRTHQTIPLSDGRSLGFAEFGDPHGKPLFLFHGQPGNRLFRHPRDSILLALGVRLITVDRPGYGLSDYQPHRTLLDWPRDVAELADSFKLERFPVLGFSGGGPYAAACAYRIPHRLTKAGWVSGSPPMILPGIERDMPAPLRLNYWLARHAPAILRYAFKAYWRHSRRRPEAFIQLALKGSAPADREILSQPDLYATLLEVWKENLRVDSRGYAHDTEILMKDWGFSLHDLHTEVYLWQGEADTNVPAAWAQSMIREVPHCKPAFFPGEGHFILFSHWQEIVQTLTGNEGDPQPPL